MSTHYYTIKNKITGEPTLVHAKNRARAERGFFERRFATELTSQHDLVKFIDAGVAVLDLTKAEPPSTSNASVDRQRGPVDGGGQSLATQYGGHPPDYSSGLRSGSVSSPSGLGENAAGINGSASPALDT